MNNLFFIIMLIYQNHPESILSADAALSLTKEKLSDVTLNLLNDLRERAEQYSLQLRKTYFTFQEKANIISHLNKLMDKVINSVNNRLNMTKYIYSREASSQQTYAYLNFRYPDYPDKVNKLGNEYITYDSFFRIYRSDNLSLIDYLYQFLIIYQKTLLDLKYAEVPPDEFCYLIELLKKILDINLSSFEKEDADKNTRTILPVQKNLEQNFDEFWQNHAMIEDEKIMLNLALYRWFCGHQLWNIVLNYMDAYIQLSIQDVSDNAPEQTIIEQIYNISGMVRCFISIIWYTMNFPSYLYQKYISPTMEQHSLEHGSKGLSGTQGQDFRHYRTILNKYHETLISKYGENTGTWPEEIINGFKLLQNNEILFHEHHIVLSQEKIELKYKSILQRIYVDNNNSTNISAIDAMRDMRDARRRKFKTVFG